MEWVPFGIVWTDAGAFFRIDFALNSLGINPALDFTAQLWNKKQTNMDF
jgi:hypothetical protein